MTSPGANVRERVGGPLPDADVRERIVSSRGVNLSVEAGAGTGKTTLLVERLLALLASGTPLRKLAVITFTRKAAAELGARLRRNLAEAREEGHAWAAEALGEIDGAAIGTTDSFCRGILADFPLQASLPPGFALVDEIAQEALLDVAWERRLTAAGPAEDSLFQRLREVGARPSVLRSLGAEIADHRDLEIAEVTPIASGDESDLVAVFEEALAPALAAAPQCRDPDDRLLRRIRALELDAKIARELGGAAAARIVLRAKRGGRKYATSYGKAAAWGGADAKEAVVEALRQLDARVDEALRIRGEALAADVADWLRAYAGEYERVKRERGLVDFRDLAVETRRLLANDGVRRHIAARWDALLLDEVQDTDPLQMEIAFLLAATHTEAAHADTIHPDAANPFAAELRPGAIFLVGDPKQSIYRFRRADIELYERARQRIAASGEALLVTANFRSHPSLLHFVNHVFDGWMAPPEGETFQARYEALLPGRASEPDDDDIRASLLLPDPRRQDELQRRAGSTKLRAQERGELEIDAVVRLVRRVLGRDGAGDAWTVRDESTGASRAARPGDVAVLVRKIAWGDRLLDALRRADVPAAVSGGKRFHAREEVRTLKALLEMIVDPDTRLTRFAALRSPAFALPDDDLVCRFDPRETAAESSGRLAEAETTLNALSTQARALALPEFLERLCEEAALLATFGLRLDGPGRVESLRLLVEATDSLSDAGVDTLPAFVRWLQDQERESARTVFGELVPAGENAVDILTMHKSKGLEFPVVVLADLAGEPSSQLSVVCDRTAGRIEFRLPGAPEVATPGWTDAASREKPRAQAEEIRLLYVAATRARDHLVLSWPQADKAFLRDLPERLGGRAGEAIDNDIVRTLRAEEWPPVEENAGRLHTVDVESVLELARARAIHALPFPDPGADGSAAPVAEDDRRAHRTGSASPPRRIVPATALARRPVPPPFSSTDVGEEPTRTGRPNSWNAIQFGIFLHKCLEISNPANPEGIAAARDEALAALGAEWTLDGDETETLLEELRRLDADPALAALRAEQTESGVRALREVPFLLPSDGGLVSGTLDLLLEQPDGTLTVVDYKSGAGTGWADDGRASGPAVHPSHRAQAAIYAWAAHRLTGRTVREVRLVFLGDRPVSQGSFAGDGAFQDEGRLLTE